MSAHGSFLLRSQVPGASEKVLKYLENMSREDPPRSKEGSTLTPKMDLYEDADRNRVTATFELPGISKEEVEVDVGDNLLTVFAESKMPQDRDEDRYTVRERSFGKFSRTLKLPRGVKAPDVKASMENGILNITFPKSAAEQVPTRTRITVN